MIRKTPKHVSILSRTRLMDDFFRVDELQLRFEQYDGSMSEPVRRLVLDRGDAVAAVVRNRDTDRLILVEQFRIPTVDNGPGWMMELPAGLVDEGESPDECLRRELEEEIGYRIRTADDPTVPVVEHIQTFYATPGGSNERLILYYVEVGEEDRVGAGGGLDEEHEDIRIVEMSREDLENLLTGRVTSDSKTLVGLMWYLYRRTS